MQPFKPNDPKEAKLVRVFSPILNLISNNITELYEGAYEANDLGRVFYETKCDPMTNVVDEQTYVESFGAFHDLFTRAGTFEYYLNLFRSIWGNSVQVEFVIPNDGHLQINIEALSSNLDNFGYREIIGDIYTYGEILDHSGDEIMFQTSAGLKDQEDVNRMMIELTPQGVFVETNLNIA